MANYYEWCIADVTDDCKVGVGVGDAPDGTLRICVSAEGEACNPTLAEEWQTVGWKALTPACARSLYHQLGLLRHLFEQDDAAEPMLTATADGYSGCVSVPRGDASRWVVVLKADPTRRRALIENLSERAAVTLLLLDADRRLTLAPRAIVAIPEDYRGAIEAQAVAEPPRPEPPEGPGVEEHGDYGREDRT